MSNGTGENEAGLFKISELIRAGSIFVLMLYFYFRYYSCFADWGLVAVISDRLLVNIHETGLLTRNHAKMICLGLLCVSLFGIKGRKDEKIRKKTLVIQLLLGSILYSLGDSSYFNLRCQISIAITSIGYLMILMACAKLSRILNIELGKDVFNELNETFPQEERLIQNEFSVNLPARYNLKGKTRSSWINIINPFRGLMVIGSPGSGKSFFVIQHLIRQQIAKGFTMMVYDFKYPDLSIITYNAMIEYSRSFDIQPCFYVINFDNPQSSDRCNPLDPDMMTDITDATESSRSILLGLNKEWITKQGDFFVESPINFLTSVIWFLKKYKAGKYCTLPHVIELMQTEYEKLFPVLMTEPEIEVLINPFISAYQNDAMEQLEGQIASAKIGMARLSSPQLYWVLAGNDFTLDINHPKHPKILCLANNPQKQQTFGPLLSLYVTRLVKVVNQKDKLKSSLVFDEFPTIYLNGIDNLIATARSNKVATCLGIQDYSQLKKDYGHDQAAVIMNIAGNIISGQVMGETSRMLAERFGKITQVKDSLSINRNDTSVSKSIQMDFAIPQSKISSLSSGEFVGMVADNPEQKIKLKMFHCEIINDHKVLVHGAGKLRSLERRNDVSPASIMAHYMKIKSEVTLLIEEEIARLLAERE